MSGEDMLRFLETYSGGPNKIRDSLPTQEMQELLAMQAEELHPDLLPYVEEDGLWGRQLRHPLVYMLPLSMPGLANRAYRHKREALAEAIEAEDWHSVVFLHERAYRLKALIDYCTGWEYDETGPLWPLHQCPEHWQLAADVWVDSENIEQNIGQWRALLMNGEHGLWLGTDEERTAFEALPDPIPAWRGGIVGDWSWTTDKKVAQFFANRFNAGRKVREALIPKADCFGYLTRRGESELLVRLVPEREALVFPEFPETEED